MNSEKKKLIIVLACIVVILAFIPLVVLTNKAKGEAEMEKLTTAIESSTPRFVYFGRANCSYCSMFKPVIEEVAETLKFEYDYIALDQMTNSQQTEAFQKVGADITKVGTPYMVIVQNGKVIGTHTGYMEEDALLEFLKEYNVVPKDSKLALNYIDLDQYLELIQSDTNQVIVIGRTGCGYCTTAKIALKSIAKKYSTTIHYFNIYDILSGASGKEAQEKFEKSLAYLTENEWGTPLMVIVKNGQLVAVQNGALSEDGYVSFLKKNGMIK